jgi:hypothetical protein
MRQYLGKQPGVVTVSGDDPKRFAAAMVEYTKEKVGQNPVWGMVWRKLHRSPEIIGVQRSSREIAEVQGIHRAVRNHRRT